MDGGLLVSIVSEWSWGRVGRGGGENEGIEEEEWD